MKRKQKKLIKYFEGIYNSSSTDKEKSYFYSFLKFIENGQESFEHKVIIFDEEEIVNYDILTIYHFVRGYLRSKCVLNFIHNKDYSQIQQGYYYDTLYQILNYKKGKFASAMLETDLSLSLMFTLSYFPADAEILGNQLVNFLEYHKKLEEENNPYKRKMKTMFGYSNIIWLSSFVANYYGKSNLSNRIKEYTRDIQIDKCYEVAVHKLFSTDHVEVNEWVEELMDFHFKNSKSDLTLPFNNEKWQYYPIEIIALLEIRINENLDIDFISNEYLKEFLPYLGNKKDIKLDDFTEKLRNRILNLN